MNRISKKLLISTIILICVLAGAFTFLSFSLADDPPAPGTPAASLSGTAVNQMDRIIDNSINGTYGDKNYYILEITSSYDETNKTANPSKLKDLVLTAPSKFKNLIIDAYALDDSHKLDETKLSYSCLAVKADKSTDGDIVDAIKKADFIYIANNPNSMYSRDVDFSEDIKNALVTAATVDYKPVIIDSFSKTISIGNADQKNIVKLIERELSNIGNAYRQPSNGGAGFMDLSSSSYYFIPIHGEAFSNRWTSGNTAKVVAIGADESATYGISSAMGLSAEGINPLPNTSILYNNGYFKREIKPSNVEFTKVAVSDFSSWVNNLPADAGIDTYDYVILESGITGAISDEAYASIAAAANSGVHFLYSDSYKAGNEDVNPDNPAPGYAYVLDKLATLDDYSRYSNVLISSSAKMLVYANSNSAKAEKDIADIILNGKFRGVSGHNSGGDSSTVYTVLEIEPAYPLDSDLAKAYGDANILSETDVLASERSSDKSFSAVTGRSGNNINSESGMYFIRNSSVRKDATSDELSFGDSRPLSNYGNDNATRSANLLSRINELKANDNGILFDYYNWSLSKAKIAHATGLKYDEVNVVHMSVTEFNTSTKSLLDNYDAIYIGGDISGVKGTGFWRNGGNYLMYSQYGETYNKSNFDTAAQDEHDEVICWWPYEAIHLDAIPYTPSESSGNLTGNDISKTKYDELIKYAEKLPVIVEKNVGSVGTDGSYTISNMVDPRSNMYKFINSIKSNSNTLWGFDASRTIKIANIDKEYGNTVSEYATVFAGLDMYAYDAEDNTMIDKYYAYNATGKKDAVDLRNILKTQRPKLFVKTSPTQYIEGDASTEISKSQLEWTYDVSGYDSYTVNLYIDDNADSRFSEDEIKKSSNNGTLKYDDLSDSFDGPLYWKLEVVVSANNQTLSASVTGLSKIRITEKHVVHLLQIMPITKGGDNTNDTLYLCTECQQSREVLKGNFSAGNNTKYSKAAQVGMGDGYNDQDTVVGNGVLNAQTTVGTKINNYDRDYALTNDWNYADHANNHGVHTHKFGIVKYKDDMAFYTNKAGTTIHSESYGAGDGKFIGIDDWDTNWFDDVKKDYDVTLDIMSVAQYQQLCRNVNDFYSDCNSSKEVESKRESYSQAAKKYELYYKCMIEVINGTYYTADSKISSDDKAEFERMLVKEMGIGGTVNDTSGVVTYSTNPQYDPVNGINDATALLTGYGKAGDKCSDYITNNLNTFLTCDKIEGYDGYVSNEFKHIADKSIKPDERKLYDFFNFWKDSAGNDNNWSNYINAYARMYIPWRDAKALERYFYDKFLLYTEYSSVYFEDDSDPKFGTFKLDDYWNCIVVGAAEGFGKADINPLGCYTLYNYIKADGNLILFHDSLVAPSSKVSGSTFNMSRLLSDSFGMSGTSEVSMTYNRNTGVVDYSVSYKEDPIGAPVNGQTLTSRMLYLLQYDNTSNVEYLGMNKYVKYDYQSETNNQSLHGAHDVRDALAGHDGRTPTDKAEQTNEGIITKYPFTIANRLQVSPTSSQGFAANVNSKKMTVYYTLEGGSPGTYSSAFAADPHDGVNNYFLYQFGNVTYTGAGHSLITGLGRNNNDERRLFINVILNSSRKSVDGPSLKLYDYSSTMDDVPSSLTNNKVKEAIDADQETNTGTDKEDYYYYVNSQDEIPTFSILPKIDSGATIKSMEVFYDLNIDGDHKNVRDTETETKDVLIYQYSESKDDNVGSNLLKKISTETGPTKSIEKLDDGKWALQLKPEYFVGNDGEYAYIVVRVLDSNDKPMSKTIRIQLKPELYELD